MNISLYLLLGLALSLPLGWRPFKLLQLVLFAYWLCLLLWSLQVISPFTFSPITWSHFFNIQFSYHIDGLARLFSILISGIGIFIFIYAAIYTQGYPMKKAKLLSLLQVFAISMLSIVITDNVIVLFLGWELTTVTSYLLIQFEITDKKANQAAFNSMFISVLGGLAMLAGFILLQGQTGSWSIQVAQHTFSRSSITIEPIFWLLLLGAITKSAQFPFYFWLPGAMKAPTPVSAYLHSATMVNAGIYLLARFHPLFVSLPYWYPTLAFFGMSTMLLAAVISLFQRDLKSILAYTTLFALGLMVYLLASSKWLAAEALAIFLLFHGLYKAAAFMWVGTIDQTYNTRDILVLRGLGKKWPTGSVIAIISLAAMAGLPPFFGFVVKEMLYEAKLAAEPISYVMMGIGIFSSMLIAAVSFKCLYYWFIGRVTITRQKILALGLLCPMILTVIILLLNTFESQLSTLLSSAATSIVPQQVKFESPYSQLSTILSLITVFGGMLCFWISKSLTRKNISCPAYLNPLIIFEKSLAGVLYFGRWFTFITQRRSLNAQLMIMLISLVLLLTFSGLSTWHKLPIFRWQVESLPVSILSILLILCGISFLLSQRFLTNMISFAVLGLLISGVFVLQGAPDVAMTQLLVEILTVIILVIALRNASFKFSSLTIRQRASHAAVAILIGMFVTILLFAVVDAPFPNHLSQYFIENSLLLAYGRNVVNVILVDFRAFDTFGEALVIFATAVAIWLLTQKKKTISISQKREMEMSVILKNSTRFLVQIMLLLSILLVFRGHNYPGGGFIGALVATSAIALYTLAFGLKTGGFDQWAPRIIALGLLFLLLSIALPLPMGQPVLSGLWFDFSFLGESVKLGTPLIFDFGIYFLITGSLSWLIAELEDKQS